MKLTKDNMPVLGSSFDLATPDEPVKVKVLARMREGTRMVAVVVEDSEKNRQVLPWPVQEAS